MQWVLLIVMVGALLFLSRFYPKVAFSILGALVIAAAVIVFTTTDIAQLNRSKLPVEDIRIENPVITPSYGGGFRLNARLVNSNPSTLLKESVISITMLDCDPAAQSETDDSCQVIGQTDERINKKVPAGQARDISQTLSFDLSRPKGTLRWKIIVTETRS